MADEDGFPDTESRALADMGFRGLTGPPEYGGQGLSYLAAGMIGEAMAKAPSLGPYGLVAGMASLGRSHVSALLPASFLSPQQHDNGVRAFDLNWVASCNCVRYSSPRSVPS